MLDFPEFEIKTHLKRIGVLTSGGDAPGMNAAIRAVVRYGIFHKVQIYGIRRGYAGLLENQIERLIESSVANIIQRGGTILKTARCPEFHDPKIRKKAANILKKHKIDGLVVIGGDGSFRGAHLLEKEHGIKVMGVPGTIDNDIPGTDDTIGFDTAVNTAIDAIDRIRDTASSHDRIFLVEVMGRDTGFIALEVGIGGGAENVIIPENPLSISEIIESLKRGIKRGKASSILVVAEGRSPGYLDRLAKNLRKNGFQTRACILGHIQRGGTPSSHDRLLASILGAAAVGYLLSGKSNSMVGVQNGKVKCVPLSEVFEVRKPLPNGLTYLTRVLAI
jgi:6-phosphofructokinase 1